MQRQDNKITIQGQDNTQLSICKNSSFERYQVIRRFSSRLSRATLSIHLLSFWMSAFQSYPLKQDLNTANNKKNKIHSNTFPPAEKSVSIHITWCLKEVQRIWIELC